MIAWLCWTVALAGPPMTEAEAHALLDELHETLVRVHPEPYAVVSEGEQQAVLEAAKKRLTGRVDPEELGAEGMRVVAALRDAHTSLSFGGDDRYLPARFEWLEDGLVLVEGDGLPPGVVQRVGGRTPQELHDELWSIVSAENAHWVRERGERLITTRSTWVALDGKARSVQVELADGSRAKLGFERSAPLVAPGLEPSTWWTLVPEAELGWLRIARCPSPDDAYRDSIEDLFFELAAHDVQTLVIDVRGNSGGDSRILDPILEYLPPDQLKSYGGFRRVSADAIEQRGLEPDDYTLVPGTDRTEALESVWTKSRRFRARTPYSGDVIVLTDQGTFSSGSWIAVLLSDNDLATVVGSPTGNAPSCYGDLLNFDVGPLDVGVSYTKWIRPDPARDPADSLVPHVPVAATVQDVLEGRDPHWAWLLERQGVKSPLPPPSPPDGLAPSVVRTIPALGEVGVDPGLDTLVIEFSEPMKDSLSLVGGGDTFPELVGEPAWSWTTEARIEVQVKLEPGRVYEVGINSARYDGFQAVDGTPALPVRWTFETAARP